MLGWEFLVFAKCHMWNTLAYAHNTQDHTLALASFTGVGQIKYSFTHAQFYSHYRGFNQNPILMKEDLFVRPDGRPMLFLMGDVREREKVIRVLVDFLGSISVKGEVAGRRERGCAAWTSWRCWCRACHQVGGMFLFSRKKKKKCTIKFKVVGEDWAPSQ